MSESHSKELPGTVSELVGRRFRPSSPESGPGRKVAAWVRRGPGDDLVVALPSVGEGEPAVDLRACPPR